MNVKTKTVIILLTTLIIGMVIGAAGSAFLRQNLLEKRIAHLKTPQGFIDRLDGIIKPDAAQKAASDKIILKKYHSLKAISMRFRELIKINFDSLLLELKPILTEKQYKRLSEKLKERRKLRENLQKRWKKLERPAKDGEKNLEKENF